MLDGGRADVFQRGANHRVDTPGMRSHGAVDAWLHQRAGDPSSDQGPGNIAVATTNIEKQPIGCKAADQADDTAISMKEPERAVFDLKAGGIAVRGIGDFGLPASEPNARFAPLQPGRQRSQVPTGRHGASRRRKKSSTALATSATSRSVRSKNIGSRTSRLLMSSVTGRQPACCATSERMARNAAAHNETPRECRPPAGGRSAPCAPEGQRSAHKTCDGWWRRSRWHPGDADPASLEQRCEHIGIALVNFDCAAR